MPALLFMGRRWGVGADEFALPSLCSMALRVIWSVALVVVLFQVGGDLRGCDDGWVVYTYMVCSLSTFALSVVVEWGITRVSTRGSIADTRPRESLSGYLNVHMMLGAVQLVMAGLGIGLMTYFDSTCEGVLADGALNVLILVVTISQIVDVLVTCCCCVLMSGNPEEAYGGGNEGYERFPPTEIEGQWESRCHWLHRVVVFLTCGLFGGRGIRQTDFEQLSKIMARIFHTEEYLDVVPSDIAAGIVLLYHKQRQQRRALASSHAGRGPWSSSASSTLRSSLLPSTGPLAAPPPPPLGSSGGWGSGNGTEDPSLRSCCSSSGRGGEGGGSGERASLTTGGGGDAVGVGGVGGAVGLPIGVRERSKRHGDFYRVEGLQVLDVTRSEDRSALEEISHFSRYALAIYTWYLYVFERPCCGACDLLCYSCTGRSRAFHRTRSSKKDWGNTTTTTTPAAAAAAAGGGSNGATAASGIDSKGKGGRSSMRNKAEKDGGGGGGGGGAGGPGVSVRGDNWLGTHEAALLRVAGLHRGCEVVDAHFASGVVETPYCVLVDHAWRCVVVSIRGTMSLDDCLCDLQAEPACMEESGRRWGFDGSGMFAHQGVLARAEWVRKDLEDQGHIRALLLGGGGGAGEDGGGAQRVISAVPGSRRGAPPRFRDYSLRVTGHSLGGSTGALLTYMLRGEYPSARCVAISPLGGLLNSPHAEDCGEFVLSSALGEDVVPRLSVMAMERMRDEVLELIARTKANKLTVMRSMVRAVSFPRGTGPSSSSRSSPTGFGGCGGCGGGGGGDLEDGDDLGGLVYRQDEPVPETRFSSQLRRYRALVDQKRAALPFPELLPAGRFVHYIKTHTNRSCCIRHWLYTPVWAKPTDFRDIVVSKRMFFDHIPTKSRPRFTETYEMLLKEGREALASGLPGRGGEGGGEGGVGAMGISMGRSGSMPDVS